eukprot:s15222_g1.t1
MTVGEKASLRRLILEAQTMLAASLKDMAEPSEGAAPKKAYVACLFKYLTKPAQQGYRKVSVRQILRADKLAFSKMSEAGEDIRADASGGKPEWLPEGLRYQGASAWNSSGNKNCYGFNLGTCTDQNCQKGDHKCICGGDHPVGKCPMKPKKL